MAATKTYSTLSLEDAFAAGEGERRTARIRRELGVESFNLNAIRAVEGDELLREHDEVGRAADRNERVFVVLSGHAVFTVDGEEVDAPAGTVVHLPVPEARRSAIAKQPGTTLLGIGGRPGEPYRPSPGEALGDFFPKHEAQDWEGAGAVAREVLEQYPGNPLALYNLACCEALLGRRDDAVAHLLAALDADPTLADEAKGDSDLDSLRDDARFPALSAAD
jgi:tetratricopeptide (TPR) repeat protein